VNRKKSCAAFIYGVTKALTLCLLALCFTGCPPALTPLEEVDISQITIHGIPARFPRHGSNPPVYLTTFKVYLNASNSMEVDDPPVAKAVARISEGIFDEATQTHTLTLRLQNPNPDYDNDPNLDTGPWSGTARFFSVMISPQNLEGQGVNSLWIRADYDLHRGKSNIGWSDLSVNFRSAILVDLLNLAPRAQALYQDIIRNDNEIVSVHKVGYFVDEIIP